LQNKVRGTIKLDLNDPHYRKPVKQQVADEELVHLLREQGNKKRQELARKRNN
jgi:hypothetical protein